MNIFYLDKNPYFIAPQLNNKHTVKMILESAQMLWTAHRELDGNDYADECEGYKTTHKNHPSAVWTRTTNKNYQWHYDLFLAMMQEYSYRYNKHHKCEKFMHTLCRSPENICEGVFTAPPQCMPDEYKCDDTVQAYRNYYIGAKSHIAEWKNRKQPEWFI